MEEQLNIDPLHMTFFTMREFTCLICMHRFIFRYTQLTDNNFINFNFIRWKLSYLCFKVKQRDIPLTNKSILSI